MHRDAKLGLVLAILVIGFAAAFCFPKHRRFSGTDDVVLQTSGLDRELGLRNVRVYLPPAKPEVRLSGLDVPPVASATGGSPVAEASGSASLELTPTVVGMTSVFAKRSALLAAPEDDEEDSSTIPNVASHVVAPGETLSGIALKHLGSTTQYGRLFEANRDVMTSPDALQVGMVLTIPSKDAPVTRIASNDDPEDTVHFRHRDDRSRAPEPTPVDIPAGRPNMLGEPVPTPVEPLLPTMAIPAPSIVPVPDPLRNRIDTPSQTRFGAASVGASLRPRSIQ